MYAFLWRVGVKGVCWAFLRKEVKYVYYARNTYLQNAKDQIYMTKISALVKVSLFWKEFFVFSILPKNERKVSAQVGYGKNQNFQVWFLEELKTPKFPFEIN